MREAIMTGKTVEEATAAALAELGLSEEEVTIEVLDLPQKRFLKSIPARVRVTVDADAFEESKEPVVLAAAAPVKQAAPAPKAAPAPVKTAEPAAPKAAKPEAATPAFEQFEEIPLDLATAPNLQDAATYLSDMCSKMGVPITVTAVKQSEAVIFKVEGEEAGSLIGHRGEVMEALSYLTSLVANRAGGDYIKLSLDINHYRSKREANLVALAKRIAAKVAKTGRSHTLEPMNPYERRIIHSAVGEVEGVKSESTGEGANRRVTILSTGPNAKQGSDRPFRQADRRTRPGAPGGRPSFAQGERRGPAPARGPRGGAPKSSVPTRDFADKPRDPDAAPIVPKRTETVNDGGDLPLYGKIEL